MNRIVPTPSHHLGRCREFTFRGSPSTVSRPGAASPPGGELESAPCRSSAAMTEYANTAARRLIRRVRVPRASRYSGMYIHSLPSLIRGARNGRSNGASAQCPVSEVRP